jgi:hypothetical protein
MDYFLGFTSFYEMRDDGNWYGYACSKNAKLAEQKSNTLLLLCNKIKYKIICHHCQSDMGASYVINQRGIITFSNLACENFLDVINAATIDYETSSALFFDGEFDDKKAQYRINVKWFGEYALCKIIGVYVEPNLLVIS